MVVTGDSLRRSNNKWKGARGKVIDDLKDEVEIHASSKERDDFTEVDTSQIFLSQP